MTVTGVVNAAAANVAITLTGTANDIRYLYRQHADGSVWPVRNAQPLTIPVGGTWTGTDSEPPFDAAFTYYATSAATTITDTSASYSVASNGLTWLKHPAKPALSVAVEVETMPSMKMTANAGTFAVIGRRQPIAVSAPRSAYTGSLTLHTFTTTDRAALLALLADGQPLLLAAPGGFTWGYRYIAIDDVEEAPISGYVGDASRRFTFDFTEVSGGDVIATVATWADVNTHNANWITVLLNNTTWNNVFQGTGRIV